MTRALLMCMPDIYQSWHETHIKGPWIGGASIAGNCLNHEVYVADLVLKRKNVRGGIDEAISMINPEIIGLSAMTFQYPTAVKVAKYLKTEYPEIKIALGGYHATATREEIAESEEGKIFDYIFAGESEHTFNDFLDKKDFQNIQGFSYKQNGAWIHNPRHPAMSTNSGLDNILLPKRESRIWKGYHFHSRSFDTAETSRGCDYACKFCSIRVMMPKAKYQAFSLERIIEDLKNIKARGAEFVFFCDDNPAMHPEQFELLNKRIIQERLNDMYYSGMVSTESMADSETTGLMRKAGWDFVFLGVENVYETNLRGMRKKSSEELAAKAIDSLHKAGISILAGLIVGNPEDTEETIRMNFEWIRKQPVDSIMLQFLTPYPGTATRKELLEEGLIINKGGMPDENEYGGWSTYNGEFAHCKTRSGLMPEEIEKIVYEEMSKFKKDRAKKLFRGKLNFAKNNPRHLFNYILYSSVPSVLRAIKEIALDSTEKAKLSRQRKIAMNQFNI